MQDKSDFTQGSIPQNIVRMAIPMTAAHLINVLYSVVDRMYLGRIPGAGALALTGIGLSFPIITMVTAFQNLYGSGGSPLFAMAAGRGDKKEAGKYLANSAFMLIVMGIILTVVGFSIKEKLLWAIGASETTFIYANDYLNIYLIGTVFVMFSLGLNPYINAQGNAKVGMMTVAIGAVVNIVLDPIFIFVLKMGVKGAALATIIAQGISAIWVLVFLTGKNASVKLSFRGFRPDFKLINKIMGLGLTEFCFSVTNSIVSMVFNKLLSGLGGDMWVASMTVISSLREIMMTLMHGITGASKPIMSYNYGAKRYDRVCECIRWMLGILAAFMTMFWIVIMLFPGFFVSIFSNDEQLYEYARIAIRLYFALQCLMCLQSAGQSTFTALGRAKSALFFSLFRKVILVVPLAIFLPKMFGLGVYGVFLSEPVSDLVGGGACCLTMYFTVYKKLKAMSLSKGELSNAEVTNA